MSNFAIIRLGKDSIADIRTIDALHQSPAAPIRFTVHCKQVPTELEAGDYVFFCFGSDNSQGAPTEWVRGVRALGTIASKTGGPGYNDPWHVAVEIKVVLPQSVVRRDLLAHAPTAYFWCSGIPTIGIEANSQQTVQMIKESESDQSVAALAYSLAAHSPVFKSDTMKMYPDLKALFDYQPPPPLGPLEPMLVAAGPTGRDHELLGTLVRRFDADAKLCSLHLSHAVALRFTSCLLSKRFLIAAGLAGSGKTKLSQALAEWLTPLRAASTDPSPHFALIPVGADWTGNDNLVGYPNGLDSQCYNSKPALELIMHAERNAEVPHFLILDEMNLSHVERYFADILSAMESEAAIPLHQDEQRTANGREIPNAIVLPPNLFIVGTVNVDETTYMFSPKVLDRANVIEFRMEDKEIAKFLNAPKAVRLGELNGKGAGFGANFVAAAADKSRAVPEVVKDKFKEEMLLFFRLLQTHHAEFGYRTSYEAGRFMHFYKELGGYGDDDATWFDAAMDAVIVQKLLPKLHGSRTKLEGLLWALGYACGADWGEMSAAEFQVACLEAGEAQNESKHSPDAVEKALNGAQARYPLSFDKILRMYRKLVRDQFVTFAEA
jgi:hypothetical protein